MNGSFVRALFFSRLVRLTALGLMATASCATLASAQYCTCDECNECNLNACNGRCCYEAPDLWIINTRCVPKCSNLDAGFDCITYKRYDRCRCCFVRESRESFLAQEATMPTLFFLHGNTLKHKGAVDEIWEVYEKMRCCPGPKRLVLWSWPAQRVYKMTDGLRFKEMVMKNLRIKYVYSEYQGYYLAKLVQQMSLSQRVMLAGHSYGAIISAAALHYLGGGNLRDLVLEGGAPVERPNLRGGMVAGAFDNDMLIPGYRYGQAFVAAEKIYVTRNIKDSTLKNWRKVSWRCMPAIGSTGVNANRLGQYRPKLCQQTMTVDVNKSHYLKPHLKSMRFVRALCCLSFPECQSCQASYPAEPEEDDIVLAPDGENAVLDEQAALQEDEAEQDAA
jgi:pimeloyl-ACP methyl ester carboxylesterase